MESGTRKDATAAIAVLLESLGISTDSFTRFVCWALAEHLVVALAIHPAVEADGFFNQPDALRQFRTILRQRTKRKWSESDLQTLFDRVNPDYSRVLARNGPPFGLIGFTRNS